MDEATEHKHRLEEKQRSEGKQRAATKTLWKPKYFNKEVRLLVRHRTSLKSERFIFADESVGVCLQGEGWVYNRPLWETHWPRRCFRGGQTTRYRDRAGHRRQKGPEERLWIMSETRGRRSEEEEEEALSDQKCVYDLP